jgi:hypothetical protein
MVNEPHFEKFEHLKFTIKENDSKGIIRREMDMIDQNCFFTRIPLRNWLFYDQGWKFISSIAVLFLLFCLHNIIVYHQGNSGRIAIVFKIEDNNRQLIVIFRVSFYMEITRQLMK